MATGKKAVSKPTDGLRPVEVQGHLEYWKGWFHGWHGLIGEPVAIVEHQSGHCSLVPAQKITFLDTKHRQ